MGFGVLCGFVLGVWGLGLGYGVSGMGLGVLGRGFEVWGLGCWVWGLGFRVHVDDSGVGACCVGQVQLWCAERGHVLSTRCSRMEARNFFDAILPFF